LANCQLSLAKADMRTAKQYMALVEPKELSEKFFTEIRDEYNLTASILLKITQQNEILENNPVIRKSIQLRNPYTDPLNYIQVELLRRIKRDGQNVDNLHGVLMCINGIAAAMQETG